MYTKKPKHCKDIESLIGKRVKYVRQISGISRKSLSEPLGITFQQLQKYESGQNRISASRLVQMSIMLDLPITFFTDPLQLYFMENQEYPNFQVHPPDPVRDIYETVNAIRGIKNEDHRKALLDMALMLSRTKQ